MSNYQRYQEALTSAGYGTPLWEPSSTTGSTSVRIGDVGYLRFGTFVRLFNATLPSGHPDNQDGEPDNYLPLVVHSTQLHRTVIPKGIIASSGVQVSNDSQDRNDGRITFKCVDKSGAVVMTDGDVVRQDAVDPGPFADYAATHAYAWVKFARDKLMREIALHDLIFLTGCDLTESRYSVTVFNEARPPKRFSNGASFQLAYPSSRTHSWSHTPSVGYFQHNYGPSSLTRPAAHCLFVRGFKILDRHVERMEREEEDRGYLTGTCGTDKYQGPLDAVLRYLCDKSNADVAIAHDMDLAKLFVKDRVSLDYSWVAKRLRKCHQPIIVHGPVASLL